MLIARLAAATRNAASKFDTMTRYDTLRPSRAVARVSIVCIALAGWFAVIAPLKLPAAEIKRLHDAVVAACATPETKEAMAQQENVIAPMPPEAPAAFLRSEQERYARLVKKAAITLDRACPPRPIAVTA